MKETYTITIAILVLVISTTACLDFGSDEETTTPTESQVNRCRAEMYLNDTVQITPLGFKLEGSGIDDVIWFKFETNTTDLSQVFDTTVVDTDKFTEHTNVMSDLQDVEWWDVEGKDLLGGQVSLPNVRYMNVEAEKIEGGYVIYIRWNET
jgi:hypothetical protein